MQPMACFDCEYTCPTWPLREVSVETPPIEPLSVVYVAKVAMSCFGFFTVVN